jgi:hypothetical protein
MSGRCVAADTPARQRIWRHGRRKGVGLVLVKHELDRLVGSVLEHEKAPVGMDVDVSMNGGNVLAHKLIAGRAGWRIEQKIGSMVTRNSDAPKE